MNCRYSKQREIILNLLQNSTTHPTAEMMYEMVQNIDNTISKSTVYRNINILHQNKDIIKISMAVGPDRYDFLHKPHHHVVCQKCGNVHDFYFDIENQNIISEIKNQVNVESSMESIVIEGICSCCTGNN